MQTIRFRGDNPSTPARVHHAKMYTIVAIKVSIRDLTTD